MRRGFTLIEVVVVLAILGIATGLAIPALSSLQSKSPNADALVALIGRARSLSTSKAVPVTLTIAPSDGRYWLREAGDTALLASGVAPVVLDAAANPARRVVFEFSADGRATGDSIIVREDTHVTIIAVDSWTGRLLRETR